MTQDPLETDRSDPIRVERKENIGCRGSAVAVRWKDGTRLEASIKAERKKIGRIRYEGIESAG